MSYYQKEAYKFAAYEGREYPFLALGEECGEVLGKLAKYVRKNKTTLGGAIEDSISFDNNGQELRRQLILELGDVLWQVNVCCTELGIEREVVEEINLDKLRGRTERKTIIGEGDER